MSPGKSDATKTRDRRNRPRHASPLSSTQGPVEGCARGFRTTSHLFDMCPCHLHPGHCSSQVCRASLTTLRNCWCGEPSNLPSSMSMFPRTCHPEYEDDSRLKITYRRLAPPSDEMATTACRRRACELLASNNWARQRL